MNDDSWLYSVSPARVTRFLAVACATLLALHLVAMQANFNDALGLKERFDFHYWQVAIFDLDEEESFGTWFSSGILLFAALLLAHISAVVKREEGGASRWWLALGAGFALLSVDEVVGLHELVNTLLEDTPWTAVAIPLVAVVGLSFLPFLWRYRGPTAIAFLIAGAIYVGGAVFVEHFTDDQVNTLHYNMWTALEEGMEMVGVIWFIHALLVFLRSSSGRSIRVLVSEESGG